MRLFAGSAAGLPLAGLAQNRSAPFRIGILGSAAETDRISVNELKWMKEGLQAEGLVEGQGFVIDARYAAGDYSRFKELARDLLANQPGAVVVSTIAGAKAAQDLTTTVPIVMLGLNDPIGSGLISSLAKPGGNITGIATLNEDLQLKLLQTLQEALPKLRSVTAFLNPRNPSNLSMVGAVRRQALSNGLTLETIEVATPDALDQAFKQLAQHRPDALFVIPDNALGALSDRIAALAAAQGVPAVSSNEELTFAGGLMSYGRVRRDLIHRAASYLRRIADGARAADLSVEQPTRFRLVLNLRTAKALGLEVPTTLLAQADEVIE
jgi:putative ABC transport system substrate-binding protein